MPFQTKVIRSRFVVSEFGTDAMLSIAGKVQTSVKDRILQGLTVDDMPAKGLKPNYAKYKQRRVGSSLRDWRMTGRTMRGLNVLSVGPGKAKIGFSDPVAGMRAHINNSRARQFGVSPKDRAVLVEAVKSVKALGVQRVV